MPDWLASPPSVMDVVTCLYPETKPKGELKLRPCLVTGVHRNRTTGQFVCQIAYGTKTLKAWSREGQDVIIQNTTHLDEIGLPVATRFALDDRASLIWGEPPFGCWTGFKSPRIGALTEAYQKEYAYCMMKRLSV